MDGAGPGALVFPEGFVWGVSTSAVQIEGAAHEDGRRDCIWDTFTRRPGKIADGSTPEVAADHYHRTREDIQIMRDLGVKAYRFSVAWPRVIPDGTGEVNPAGLDFYDRLVDDLIAAGIEPWVCLYHWDLPQAVQDRGGWAWRKVADAFERYTEVVADRLVDRVPVWVVMNEVGTFTLQGYLAGVHAPGKRSPYHFARAIHLANLAQGKATAALRRAGAKRVGTVVVLRPTWPATSDPKDIAAAERVDDLGVRLFLDPVFRGTYPSELAGLLRFVAARKGDMAQTQQPLDFIGVNTYGPARMVFDRRIPLVRASEVPPADYVETTDMGWEVSPRVLKEAIETVWQQYRVPVFVTENGAAYTDVVGPDGAVDDPKRVGYFARHIAQVNKAIEGGANVGGYFAWSLLDNFEWAEGYSQRFGLVHVDFETQKRTIKTSGRFFADVIARNGLDRDYV